MYILGITAIQWCVERNLRSFQT